MERRTGFRLPVLYYCEQPVGGIVCLLNKAYRPSMPQPRPVGPESDVQSRGYGSQFLLIACPRVPALYRRFLQRRLGNAEHVDEARRSPTSAVCHYSRFISPVADDRGRGDLGVDMPYASFELPLTACCTVGISRKRPNLWCLSKGVQMPRQRRRKTTTVIVSQASSVELTKRGSANSLNVQVRSGKDLLGNLVMGRGSVQWWPDGNRTKAFKKSWPDFIKLLENIMAAK